MGERQPLSIAILGNGVAGERHSAAHLRLGNNVTLFDVDSQCSQNVAASLGNTSLENGSTSKITVARTAKRTIADADVVYVATPDHLHTALVVKAVEAGKPVVVEKPLTTRFLDAQRVHDASVANDIPVVTGTYYRLTPSFMKARDLLATQQPGSIRDIRTTYLHSMVPYGNTWRDTQNFLYGGGIHAIDLLVHMMDQDRLVAIQGVSGGTEQEKKQNRNCNLQVIFESGAVGSVRFDGGGVQEHGKHGTDLVITADNLTVTTHNKWDYVTLTRAHGTDEGRSSHVDAPGDWRTVDTLAKIMSDFVGGVRKDYAPMPQIGEALHVMRVAHSADTALKTGRTVYLNRE